MKLPKNWIWSEIVKLAKINTRSLTANTPRDYRFRYVDLSCVCTGRIDWPKEYTHFAVAPSRARRLVAKGDVLMSMVRPNLQGFAQITHDASDTVVSTGFAVLTPRDNCDGAFLFQSLLSGKLTAQVNRLLAGSGYPALNSSEIEDLVIATPENVVEQRKIGDILTTWDLALEKLDALIAAKERRKKALMEKLISGKRRQSKDAWKSVKLSEVAEEQNVRNKGTHDRTRLFAVTKAEGMVPMRERVQGATTHRCKIVEKGWFAYNPMRLNIGSIAQWDGASPVMVSGDYVVFRTDEKRLLSDYLKFVRQSAAWAAFVGASGNGSVRIRIWFDDLGQFKFSLPSLGEQRAIANIFNACDEELRLMRAQRSALNQQKRGLMQRLLTGKVRVRVAQSHGQARTSKDQQ